MNTISFHTRSCEGQLRRSVALDSLPEREYYLEAPQEYAAWVTEKNDFLLLLILRCLMEQGGEFHISGAADAVLLRHLEEFSRIWARWCPGRYKPIRLSADSVGTSAPEPRAESIVAFSGGVDACFTLYGHEHGLFGAASQRVRACALIHGADIRLDDAAGFDLALASARRALEGRGVYLIPVRTNYRCYPHDWEMCFSEVVVAALMMFSARFALGSCGADTECTPSGIKIPWGQNYITDHLRYPSYFHIYTTGASFGRTERCHYVSRDALFMRHLRVCWQVNAHGANCGVCEKCQRTMLNFMAAGYTGELPFPCGFSVEKMLRGQWNGTALRFHREILEYNDAVTHALPAEVRSALLSKIRRTERSELAGSPPRFLRSRFMQRLCRALIGLAPRYAWRSQLRKRFLVR